MDVTHKQKQVTGILPKMFLILLGTALITLSSYITVPMYPVPVTAQTLVLLLIGLSYGPQLAFLKISLYLTQGAFGLPMFAGGAAGLTALLGPTGGIFLASWRQAVFSD